MTDEPAGPHTIVPGDRGRRGPGYTLLTPANRYVSRLPSLPGASLFKLATPRLAPARFGEYLIVAGDQPVSCPIGSGLEHFVLAMSGDCAIWHGAARRPLGERGFGYLPAADDFVLEFAAGASLLWIKRPYEAWPGLAQPAATFGLLRDVEAAETAVDGLMRRELLDPADPAFDFNISHMEFGPGVALAQIEIHDEEHGLYMTAGGGVYRLGSEELEVQADDFIYMAPYCPQGFRAGPHGGSYLLYKDVYRDGF